ncbi:hypothetical protein AGOR_G00168940 [Albula goreensis]|uniref:Calcineurin-like phosphoesterase domain-containing protein n=1 Tax=Albula goreensis TaxID=1534307 RepID=A0A8T3D205_9TELE|nr:hypothetical protein AGOR_G00168940 [Albula goreensis]
MESRKIMYSLGKLSVEVKVAIATGVVFFSMLISRTLLSDAVDIDTRAKLFRVQFLLLVNSFLLIGSLYIWKRTVSAFTRSRCVSQRVALCWRLVVMLFLVFAHSSYLTMFYLVAEEPYWLAMVSYTCLGAYIILVFFLFAFGCVGYCHKHITQDGSPSKPDLPAEAIVSAVPSSSSNRQAILAVALTVVLTAFGLMNASLPPEVVRVEIPLPKLPPSLDNLKIVLLSDIHLGPTVGRSRLELIVHMVNNLDADVVVIAGDLTDSQVSRLLTVSEPLRNMKSKLGSYFVTGNHDYYTADVERWYSHLRSLNIQPLHNGNARVFRAERKEDWICLAGVDDLEARMLRYPGHGMDVKKALTGCAPELPIILLAHQPRAARQALQERPDIGLVLSGHTHAGQIFPLSILAYLVNPFFCGLYRVGEHSMVYVSPGTVYYGIPMRLGSRAEITEILLRTP